MKMVMILAGLVTLIIGSVIVLDTVLSGDRDPLYGGKEVFYTEEDYGNFKIAVGSQEVDIQEVEVLSSSPPVVVEYVIKATPDYDFPYGERKEDKRRPLLLAIGGILTVGGVVGTALGLLIRKED